MLIYGADPTGETDTTDAIISALQDSRDVTFPAGSYIFDGGRTATITATGKSILAMGAEFVISESASAKPTIVVRGDNVMIDGLTIVGNGDVSTPNNGIEIRGAAGATGRNLHLSKCQDGIYIGKDGSLGCTNVTLENVICDQNKRHGLAITYCDGAVISSSVFSNTRDIFPGYGVDVEPNEGETCQNLRFENCEAFGNLRTGLVLTGQAGTIQNIEWINGSTHDNDQDGIRLYNAHGVLLTGQSFDNARDDVRIEGGSTDVDNRIV